VAQVSPQLLQGMVKKALNDFPFFCRRCFYIRRKDGVVTTLTFNYEQRKIWEAMKEQMDANQPVRIVVLKPRQIGISTLMAAFLLWEMVRRPVFTVTMAHKDEAVIRIFGMVKFAYERLPEWLTITLNISDVRNSWSGIELSHNHSQIERFSAEGKEPGRSGTIQIAHVSEVAFYPAAEQFLASLFSAIPELPGTAIIQESTGNTPVGYFPERYNRAKQGLDGYKALFFPWYEHEEYRMKVPPGEKPVCPESLRKLYEAGVIDDEQLWWRQHTIGSKYAGKEYIFCKEFPATEEEAFHAESANYFPVFEVEKRLREVDKIPYDEGDILPGGVFSERPGAELRVYKHPVPGRCYVIGADASSGVAAKAWVNYSSADVLDVETGEQVAKMLVLDEPEGFARRLQLLGEWYNTALIAPETNDGHGLTVARWLRDAGYKMLYQRRVYDRVDRTWTNKLGWLSSPRTKPYMLDVFRSCFISGRVTVNDERTLREMLAFVKDGNKLGAVVGATDDSVLSFGVAVMAWKDYGPHLSAAAKPLEPEEPVNPTVNIRMRSRIQTQELHPDLGAYF